MKTNFCLQRIHSFRRRVIQDKVNEFRGLAQSCDGFVFGTPVYYAGMNGSLKAFMDRLFLSDLWGGCHTFTRKPAASVITARRAGTTAAYLKSERAEALGMVH